MQTDQLKSIFIKDYLDMQGVYPAKEHSTYGMYKSPFRDEHTPSFKVDYTKNLWHDFGSGEGGSIIDLVMKMHECNFIQAKEHLSNKSDLFSFDCENSFKEKVTKALSISEIKPLENLKILQFLQSRKICVHIVQAYCKEIHYQIGGRNYFAIGFPNDMGGYELRNPQFKGCFPPKEITTFDEKTPAVHLFEGFTDYLSLLTMQASQSDVSAVVLNSVNNLEKVIPFLAKHTKINAFLDNDEAGKQALEKLQKLNFPVVDISKRYADFKDVNDLLYGKKMAKNQLEITPKITKSKGLRR